MASGDQFSEEFISRLRNCAKEAIEYISENTDIEELPERNKYTHNDESKLIEQKTKFLEDSAQVHREKLEDIFRKLAEWAVENTSESFEVELYIETQPGEDIKIEDINYNPNSEEKIEVYIRRFVEFTSSLLEYSNNLNFDESSFQAAVSELEETTLDIPQEYIVICPIVNLDLSVDNLRLANEFDIADRQEGEWVKKIEISDLTMSEKAMIYNAEKRSQFRDTGLGNRDWPNRIKITMEGFKYASNAEQIVETITSSLRLLSPDSEPVAAGPQYRYKPERPYIDGKVPRWSSMTGPEFILRTARTGVMHELDSERSSRMEEFWDKNANLINPYGNSEFSAAIRRYNETYKKSNFEDRIVDAVIAIEGTVLKDLGNQSSISFRLGTRCALLLDERKIDQDILHLFLKNLYYSRGEIVHKNRQIDDIMSDDRFRKIEKIDTEKDFVNETRILLSKIIRAYLSYKNATGKNITEINQDIDNTLRDTSYSPTK